MKKLAALLISIFSLIFLLLPPVTYAANCINTAGYTRINPDCANRYADTVCRPTPTTYYKLATVTYFFGEDSCTRTEHVTDAATGCSVIYPTCRGVTCNAVPGDEWTVDCGTSGICLPPNYTTASACAGTACVTTGGGCIQVHNCSHSNCVSNACTTQLEDATCTTYAACQTTNSTAGGYCAAPPAAPAPAPAVPAPSTTPAPTSAPAPPAGSCTFRDNYYHKPSGNDCELLTAEGTCTCGYTATFNYTTQATCNIYPNGVRTNQQGYTFNNVTCTPPPTPNCNSGIDCDTCSGAPANTCSTNNGTQSCTYTTHSSGVSCTTANTSRSCTINNCSTNFHCEWGECVGLRPWIQVTGDIHSNINIDLPPGPR